MWIRGLIREAFDCENEYVDYDTTVKSCFHKHYLCSHFYNFFAKLKKYQVFFLAVENVEMFFIYASLMMGAIFTRFSFKKRSDEKVTFFQGYIISVSFCQNYIDEKKKQKSRFLKVLFLNTKNESNRPMTLNFHL
jgi:hypothetical protein